MENTVKSGTLDRRNYIISITTIGFFFFIFGAVTWLNAVLIPFLKIACALKTDLEAYLVTFVFYIAYVVMAIPSSWILKKTGFKRGISVGLYIMAAGALIFIPAALTRTYAFFLLVCLFLAQDWLLCKQHPIHMLQFSVPLNRLQKE